jgi:hypothetical protein
MKRLFMTFAFAVMTVAGMQAQLLYKISGNGLTKPSYIIGTYHLAPVSFADSIPGLKEAMAATEQVYGELDMTDLTSAENLQKMQTAMMLPEGTTLSKLLTAEEMARLNVVLKELMGVDMTNQMVAQQLDGLSPQALQTQLSLLIYMKKHDGFNPQATFDGYFQQVAQQQGKGVGGLETVDFQVGVLFHGQSLERQKELLMCLVDNKEHTELMAEQLVEAFFKQDLVGVKAVMDEKEQTKCDSTPEEEDALIYNRNANWAKLMPRIMADKATFFAVGAGHLPGEKGVLQLLQSAGYTVEGVR